MKKSFLTFLVTLSIGTGFLFAQIDTLNVIYEFNSPASDPWGLTWDGSNLWIGDCPSGWIYKSDKAGQILDSIKIGNAKIKGITFVNDTLWALNSEMVRDTTIEGSTYPVYYIYQIDKSDGNKLDSIGIIASPPLVLRSGDLWGLEYYNEMFYVSYNGGWGSSIIEIDKEANKSLLCCTHLLGMTTAYDSLWAIRLGGNLITTTDGKREYWKYTIDFSATDIAFDGTNFWVVDVSDNKIKKLKEIISPAENRITFVDSNANWYVANTYPEYPNFIKTTTRVYGFIGDTLINGVTWHKFYSTSDSLFSTGFLYHGSIKELNGLVLFMDESNKIDTLYNFNLKEGDSIFYSIDNELIDSGYMYVEKINSVEIAGNYYKSFHFEEIVYPPFYYRDTWIEGIGSIKGPLHRKNPQLEGFWPYSFGMTCYNIDNLEIWKNPLYDKCYINIIPTSSLNLRSTEIKIYPNPVIEELIIEIPGYKSKNCIISIYDLSGKEIYINQYPNSQKISINTSKFRSNIYILKISLDGNISAYRFIKH